MHLAPRPVLRHPGARIARAEGDREVEPGRLGNRRLDDARLPDARLPAQEQDATPPASRARETATHDAELGLPADDGDLGRSRPVAGRPGSPGHETGGLWHLRARVLVP